MEAVQPRFGVWDYVVLVIVLLISSAIGIYYRFTGGKQKTMKVTFLLIFIELCNLVFGCNLYKYNLATVVKPP